MHIFRGRIEMVTIGGNDAILFSKETYKYLNAVLESKNKGLFNHAIMQRGSNLLIESWAIDLSKNMVNNLDMNVEEGRGGT